MRSSHISYRTSNPALNINTFKRVSSSSPFTLDQKMTIKGTVDKTAVCLILLLIPAYYVFTTGMVGYAIPGAIIGFILAMVTIFNRKWAQYTVPAYSVAQGFFLGGISYYYNESYEGIVLQSISLTIFILFSLLFAYRSKIIRPDENFNEDYFFVNEMEFKRLINNQEFLEYAKVFNNFYGTTRTPVIDKLNKGKNVLFDIDWQGADQIKNKNLDYKLISFFILPPSKEILFKRLSNRDMKDN